MTTSSFNAVSDVNGKSQRLINYAFIDSHPYFGINYYRLRQVDFDERQSNSSVISVLKEASASYHLFPNPAREVIYITSSANPTYAKVTLHSMNGVPQLIKKEIVDKMLKLDVNHLPEGLYLLEVLYSEFVIKERIMLMPK